MVAAKRKLDKKEKQAATKKIAKAKETPKPDDAFSSDDGENLMEAAVTGKYDDSDHDDDDDDDDDNEEEEGDWETQSDEDKPERKSGIDTREAASGEIEGLKETEKLFKSNLFKLEIEELLDEIKVDYTKHKALEKALHHLKAVFDDVPEGEEQTLLDFESTMKKKNKIVTPFPSPRPSPNMQSKFKFEKPDALHIVGSYALKTVVTVKKQFNVDVVVMMPSSIFQEKDHMNNRYFYKRACYLAVLANAIIKSKKGFSVEYSTCDGDLRRPILLVKHSGDKSELDFSKTKCTIRILLGIASDVFPLRRLVPSKNNVRQKEESASQALEPTPLYNASILYDTAYRNNLAFLYQHSKNCHAFKDAIKLVKVWAHQRGLASSTGQTSSGINTYLLSMIMAYLLQGGGGGSSQKLASGHTSYQLMRGTLDFIAHHDFAKEPVFIGHADLPEFSLETFTANYAVVIVDPTGTLNLAANVTLSGLAQLQYEAKIAMTYFDDVNDRFEPLFLRKVDDDLLRYDHVMKFALPEAHIKQYDTNAQADCPSYLEFYAKTVGNILRRGLSNRANLVAVHYDTQLVWSVGKTMPDGEKDATLTVGLVLNSDNAPRLVDQGPDSQDTIACKEFKGFWGPKAELRRFKDGSILECVVWETKGYENRSLIVQKMILYLLKHHLQVEADKVHYWAGQLYRYIHLAKAVPDNLFSPELTINAFQPVMTAFTEFSKNLRSLDDALPLVVSHVYPASPCLRYATVTPPHPVDFSHIDSYPTTTRYFDAIDVNVKFNPSSKWPSDLTAIQKVKHAFYLKMAEMLQSRFGVRSTVVDSVEVHNPLAIRGCLDVFYGGFVFRCHLHIDEEGKQLNAIIKNPKETAHQKSLASEALEKYEKLSLCQRHTFNIQALCVTYTALSSTMRLVKRWFGAHLLSTQVPEELMELICAHVFAEPHPWGPATSTFSGFARVLHLLATWNWKETPLIVDPQAELSADDRDNIAKTFTQYRHMNPEVTRRVMYIATAADPTGSQWAEQKPSRIVAERIRMLAKASYDVLEHALATGEENDIKRLFVTPMQDYNVVIHLNPARCTRYFQNLAPEKKYLPAVATVSELGSEAYAQLDPAAAFAREIDETYSHVLMVFHNKYGGDKVALVWNPAAAEPRPFKVNLGFNSVPVDMKKSGSLKPAAGKDEVSKLVVPNYAAIIAEIERLGAGLIKKIEMIEKA